MIGFWKFYLTFVINICAFERYLVFVGVCVCVCLYGDVILWCLGPGCSETAEPIAAISKHFNTIVISYGAESLHLTNRAMFPLFFRTVPYVMQFRYRRFDSTFVLDFRY